jgi:integrase/recombinase XerC/integrase/recombinase XerD
MSRNTNPEVSTSRAKVWLTPDQVEELRTAAHAECFADHLGLRNETMIAVMYDAGLRVSELVSLDVDMLRLDSDDPSIYLPTHIQKDYPTDQSPPPATLKLTDSLGTARLLQSYLNNRWRKSEALFPSQKPGSVSTKQVRNVVKNLSQEAGIEPYRVDGARGDPSDVTPHSLRHSVAYRMLHNEDARMYDVRNRLRHTSIQTTEQIYEHFIGR